MAALLFPPGSLDPEVNEKCSRRARRLGAPPRSEVRFAQPGEWLCRVFFFSDDEDGDLLISVCGTHGVVATEVRTPRASVGEPVGRETNRVETAEGNVFRDAALRVDPFSLDTDLDFGHEPRFVMEFMEPERYACIAAEQVAAASPEFELVAAFGKLWPELARVHVERAQM